MSRVSVRHFPAIFLGSGFFTGYSPFASGTVGTFAALLLYWFIPGFSHWFIIVPVTVIGFTAGIPIGGWMEKIYGPDPSKMVWDEFIGMWTAVLFLPKSILLAMAAFLLFRLFDIIKPYPASVFDRRLGGLSIMMDDVVAGIYTNICLQIALLIVS